MRPTDEKTVHYQTKEYFEEKFPKLKETEPISGGSVENGVVKFTSGTFNDQKDEWHKDSDRKMGPYEEELGFEKVFFKAFSKYLQQFQMQPEIEGLKRI